VDRWRPKPLIRFSFLPRAPRGRSAAYTRSPGTHGITNCVQTRPDEDGISARLRPQVVRLLNAPECKRLQSRVSKRRRNAAPLGAASAAGSVPGLVVLATGTLRNVTNVMRQLDEKRRAPRIVSPVFGNGARLVK